MAARGSCYDPAMAYTSYLRSAGLVAALAVAGQVPAQVGEGDMAPAIDIDEALNKAPDKYSAFRGKVLLLDFFATW